MADRAMLVRKARFLRDELRTVERYQSAMRGRMKAGDVGSWRDAAFYLRPEIILRLDAKGGLLWINVPGVGVFPPDQDVFVNWVEGLPQSDGETVSDALTTLRREISGLGPDKEKVGKAAIGTIRRIIPTS